jgi:hypothetical protein
MDDLVGLFASVDAGQRARQALVAAGIDEQRIVLSANMLEDAIAAEFPGQAYENQDYASSDQVRAPGGWTDRDQARYGSQVRSAACIVNVRLDSRTDLARVSVLLVQAGARGALTRPREER